MFRQPPFHQPSDTCILFFSRYLDSQLDSTACPHENEKSDPGWKKTHWIRGTSEMLSIFTQMSKVKSLYVDKNIL